MPCAICGTEVCPGEQGVATRDGGIVHLRCAEQEASQAWKQRRSCAMLQAILSIGVVVAAWLITRAITTIVYVVIVLFVTHMLIHRRWWYYVRVEVIVWIKQICVWRVRW